MSFNLSMRFCLDRPFISSMTTSTGIHLVFLFVLLSYPIHIHFSELDPRSHARFAQLAYHPAERERTVAFIKLVEAPGLSLDASEARDLSPDAPSMRYGKADATPRRGSTSPRVDELATPPPSHEEVAGSAGVAGILGQAGGLGGLSLSHAEISGVSSSDSSRGRDTGSGGVLGPSAPPARGLESGIRLDERFLGLGFGVSGGSCGGFWNRDERGVTTHRSFSEGGCGPAVVPGWGKGFAGVGRAGTSIPDL